MEFKVYKESRLSKENKPYDVFVIEYRGYKKIVFLNGAEKFVFENIPVDLLLVTDIK